MHIALSKNVLILAQDSAIAELQRGALSRANHHVTVATTARDAICLVTRASIDLVVMDYGLREEVSGLALYAALQAAAPGLPVIIVSDVIDAPILVEAFRRGVSDFVARSAHYLDYLPEAIERVLKQVRTERQSAQAEDRFHSFMDNSPTAAFIKDEEGRVVYANRFFARLLPEEWYGKTMQELFPASAEKIRQRDLDALEGKPGGMEEQAIYMPDGTLRYWLICMFPIPDDSGKRFVGGVAVDITSRRRTEELLRQRDEQLRQAQKMEAIGTLAGGVAHEFNNLLQAITGYTQYAVSGLDQNSQPYHDLVQVIKAAEQAAALTRQLLGFSRQQTLERKNIDVNTVVSELSKMLRPIIGHSVELALALCHKPAVIHADSGQLQQVLMNLCINARDAMPSGGRLTLATSVVEVRGQDRASRHLRLRPGCYVKISVADTGSGIDPEARSRIFEPFFTTKGAGKGTGLGLAVAYGIIQQHDGEVQVDSEPGQGTEFTIFLPAVAASLSSTNLEDRPAIAGGAELILLAEDETLLRELAVRILRAAGYRLLIAENGADALQQFESHADDISMAVLDIVMPKMTGPEVYRNIIRSHSMFPVVFCSGYAPDSADIREFLGAGLKVIHKPFRPDVLLSAVRETLDASAPCLIH